MRYIPIDNGIQRSTAGMAVAENGRAWRYMIGVVCISVYGQHGDRAARYAVGAGTAQQEGIYLCTICEHSIHPPSPELRNARVRVSRARVRACVRYIIIIL